MLTEINDFCTITKNWFECEKHTGTFTISGGNITADFLQPGQYFRIMGSVFSDGVHQYPADDLFDETFEGQVWALNIRQEFINDAKLIYAWRQKYENPDSAAMSPFTSETLFDYSYSKGANASGGAFVDWTVQFRSLINKWRKI